MRQGDLDGNLGDAAQIAGDVVERSIADDVVRSEYRALALVAEAERVGGLALSRQGGCSRERRRDENRGERGYRAQDPVHF